MDKKMLAIIGGLSAVIVIVMIFLLITVNNLSSAINEGNQKENSKETKEVVDENGEVKEVEVEKKPGLDDYELLAFEEKTNTVLSGSIIDENTHMALVKVAIAIEKNNKKADQYKITFDEKNIIFEDKLIQILGEKSFEEMKQTKVIKQVLKNEIKEEFNKLYGEDVVKEVYFDNFYVQ